MNSNASGTFTIYGVDGQHPTEFKYWMKRTPPGDPSGSLSCARTRFRFADPNASEPYAEQYKSRGILASGCADLIVEANVVDLERADSIVHRFCGRVHAENNSKSSGQLIQCADMDTGKKLDELATAIEDATLMCL